MSADTIPVLRNFIHTANVTANQRHGRFPLDASLLAAAIMLLALGLVMVASASVSIAERQMDDPLFYLWRQSAFVVLGLLVGFAVLNVRLVYWERLGPWFLLLGMSLLVAVLLLGREINGSVRWLSLGPVNFQPSEMMKLFIVIYLAGYLVRRGDEVRESVKGFLKPMLLVGLIGVLLLLEPDFGAAAVITATVLGMMFLGGVRLWQFAVLFLSMSAVVAAVAVSSPYRVERLTSFVNPWADPFDSGFQLTQALIAFGRGEWMGVGLGSSVQKLFYLPEAHTDFLFAVLAEELGLIGVVLVIGLFVLIVWRAFVVGQSAAQGGDRFGAYTAYGIGIWLGLQAFINLGVNMGMLPTKGLTLPLMSYGGSSIVMSCVAVALLLRISHEYPVDKQPAARRTVPTLQKTAQKTATKRRRSS
ncbi:MAG: putative lipid II flippase FtsW [Gammaproteobacteria bacterium]|nr:putative lipid II flippase FtsW [Gammaproteobacteria bacterium]MCF6259125.1 putative lipid II flippase FtsW [Gammaproteobacteria bacterium]